MSGADRGTTGAVAARLILQWWEGKRPVGWTVEQHVEQPRVNTTGWNEGCLADYAAKLATPSNQPSTTPEERTDG